VSENYRILYSLSFHFKRLLMNFQDNPICTSEIQSIMAATIIRNLGSSIGGYVCSDMNVCSMTVSRM